MHASSRGMMLGRLCPCLGNLNWMRLEPGSERSTLIESGVSVALRREIVAVALEVTIDQQKPQSNQVIEARIAGGRLCPARNRRLRQHQQRQLRICSDSTLWRHRKNRQVRVTLIGMRLEGRCRINSLHLHSRLILVMLRQLLSPRPQQTVRHLRQISAILPSSQLWSPCRPLVKLLCSRPSTPISIGRPRLRNSSPSPRMDLPTSPLKHSNVLRNPFSRMGLPTFHLRNRLSLKAMDLQVSAIRTWIPILCRAGPGYLFRPRTRKANKQTLGNILSQQVSRRRMRQLRFRQQIQCKCLLNRRTRFHRILCSSNNNNNNRRPS
mmetsp:Transcript_1479/g.3222  ORF Transcript_1479/g.3222 Transcript_1479/m.3222 type:complete len:323 (-) Transcript_1479:1717-2685(-)